ncbi:MAG: hypothetical protein J6B68_05855 [Lachnospiraceae bacterium]|nr:hypothetical protein [Lachnospiraceae bacterium]
MDKWKKIGKILLFPHVILIFFLVNISVVLLAYAFCDGTCPEIVAYISYFVSAYTLTVVCARMPGIFKRVKRGLYSNRYANRYLTEKELRIRISLYGGLLLNIAFAIFKVIMGVLYQSKWLFAMAGYNTILSVMRFVLVYRDQINLHNESDYERKMQGLHSYKVCGWLMILLNSAISVIVMIVVFGNQTIAYPGYMIYAIAAYAFYCLTMAIINLVKYWHRENPIFSAVKRIGMAKALVSIFTLQVAMLTQFGNSGSNDNRMANAMTGIAVCVFITVMAVLMLKGVKTDYAYMKQENTKGKE